MYLTCLGKITVFDLGPELTVILKFIPAGTLIRHELWKGPVTFLIP